MLLRLRDCIRADYLINLSIPPQLGPSVAFGVFVDSEGNFLLQKPSRRIYMLSDRQAERVVF